MKNLLTISSSFRSRGNGDTLLSLCEKNLSDFNQTKLYLKDFNIQSCTGCMSCAANKEFCRINDDLRNLIDQILNSDVLIISSPVYFLGAASIIKALNDRLLFMHNLVNFSERKPAGIIVTAGREGWEGYSIQNISVLLLSLGFYVKDVLVAYGQGPSEVLLNNEIENKVQNFTKNIADPDYKVSNISDKCPVCFGDSFNLVNSKTVKCPVCNIQGKIIEQENNKTLILFSENDINNSRWSPENLKEHMECWVAASGQKYREKVRDILKVRKILLNS